MRLRLTDDDVLKALAPGVELRSLDLAAMLDVSIGRLWRKLRGMEERGVVASRTVPGGAERGWKRDTIWKRA